jgi:hypothetical protein
MPHWLKGFGNAVLLGAAWAIVWAPIAIVLGTFIIDPDNSMDEMWFAVGAFPAVLCALLFSGFLALAETGLEEVSLPRAGAWGAVAGVMVGAIPFASGTPNPNNADWLGLAVMGSFALLSAASAIGSALLIRIANRESRAARSSLA